MRLFPVILYNNLKCIDINYNGALFFLICPITIENIICHKLYMASPYLTKVNKNRCWAIRIKQEKKWQPSWSNVLSLPCLTGDREQSSWDTKAAIMVDFVHCKPQGLLCVLSGRLWSGFQPQTLPIPATVYSKGTREKGAFPHTWQFNSLHSLI